MGSQDTSSQHANGSDEGGDEMEAAHCVGYGAEHSSRSVNFLQEFAFKTGENECEQVAYGSIKFDNAVLIVSEGCIAAFIV